MIQKFVWVNKNCGSKKDLGQNILRDKNVFRSKYFWVNKNFGSTNCVCQNNCWVKTILGLKQFLGQNNSVQKKFRVLVNLLQFFQIICVSFSYFQCVIFDKKNSAIFAIDCKMDCMQQLMWR